MNRSKLKAADRRAEASVFPYRSYYQFQDELKMFIKTSRIATFRRGLIENRVLNPWMPEF